MGLKRSYIQKAGASGLARTSRIQNVWKGGADIMAWAKSSGAAAGFVANIYGSSDPGAPSGTGVMGDGSSGIADDTSKQTLVATLHPTTASVGATGINAVLLNQIFFWDFLFVEIVSVEGTTTQCEVTITGRDA